MFVCAEVEIAVGAPKARNADKGNSKSKMPFRAEKKSSFATDKWLVQCETAKKRDVQSATSEQNNVSSLQHAGEITTASNCGAAVQPAGPKWATSNWHERRHISPSDERSFAEKAELYKHRSRSRSPLDNANSVAQISSKRSHSSRMSESAEQVPLRTSFQHLASSSATIESYSTKRGKDQHLQIERNIDYMRSQVNNATE